MGRPPRIALGNYAYHVLNRGNGRMRLFERDSDYLAFEQIIFEALERLDIRLCAYCVMPNHWHMLVWPREDGQLSDFFRWLGVTHTNRWHAHRKSAGLGHIYQGRYKSFPVERDPHFLTVARYVEANALRAGLVDIAERWRYSSLWRRMNPTTDPLLPLSPWPVERPTHWLQLVNLPIASADMARLRASIARGQPFGSQTWQAHAAIELKLDSTFRLRGRPRSLAAI